MRVIQPRYLALSVIVLLMVLLSPAYPIYSARQVQSGEFTKILMFGKNENVPEYQGNGFIVSDFAIGFTANGGIGPVGLAFDSAGNLFVTDLSDGYLYKFGPEGGVASDATRVNASPIEGGPAGLAFSKDGHLYLALQSAEKVVEINPTTGAQIRIIAENLCGATGIATDPISGDLFVSEPGCSSRDIVRISDYVSGFGKVVVFSSPGTTDGLTFAPDGTLYAALSGQSAIMIAGTNATNPGTPTEIARVPFLDGIAVASDSTFLLVNRNDGKITKIDLTTKPAQPIDIFTGGTRGDFIAVGPDGCLYATQSTKVLKVTNADGSCSLFPTSPVKLPLLPVSRIVWIVVTLTGLFFVGIIAIVIVFRRSPTPAIVVPKTPHEVRAEPKKAKAKVVPHPDMGEQRVELQSARSIPEIRLSLAQGQVDYFIEIADTEHKSENES